MSLQDFLSTYYHPSSKEDKENQNTDDLNIRSSLDAREKKPDIDKPRGNRGQSRLSCGRKRSTPRPRPPKLKIDTLEQIQPPKPKRRISKRKSIPIDLSKIKVESEDMMDESED